MKKNQDIFIDLFAFLIAGISVYYIYHSSKKKPVTAQASLPQPTTVFGVRG